MSERAHAGHAVREPRPAYAHAFWWGMFAQGGMVAAILLPVHILVQGVLGPLGIVPHLDGSYQRFAAVMANPLAKLYVLVLVAFPVFHAAHRLHFWLHHLGLRHGHRATAWLSYGAAIVITLAAIWVLYTSPHNLL
jgi:fumarate reductase subunit D